MDRVFFLSFNGQFGSLFVSFCFNLLFTEHHIVLVSTAALCLGDARFEFLSRDWVSGLRFLLCLFIP
jgi:hypothetical protein